MIDLVPLTSLPRSGSTLLMNVMAQNPMFFVAQDSDLSLFISNTKEILKDSTSEQQIPYQQYHNCAKQFCMSGTKAWIDSMKSPDQIFLDKSRTWLQEFDYIYKIIPNTKSICIIRDLRGIVNSFEKIHNNSYIVNRNKFNYNLKENLLKQRVDDILNLWFLKEGIVSLKELIDLKKSCKNNIFFVKYENLTSDPQDTMNQIYDFLDLEQFNHDFDNINQIPFYDNPYQPYGCHKIKSRIENLKQIYTELNSEITEYIVQEYRWYYEEFYPEVF